MKVEWKRDCGFLSSLFDCNERVVSVERCKREGCYSTVDCDDGYCKKHSKTKKAL